MNPWRGVGALPREVWIQCIATFVNRSGTMVLPFLALYLHRTLGYSVQDAGIALTVYGIGAFATAPFSGRISDRVGARRLMIISLLLTGCVVFTLLIPRSFAVMLMLIFLWSIISEAFRPASLVSITELVTADQRKTAFAVNRLAVNLGMSIGPALGGFLILFSYPLLFVVDGATSIVAGIVLALSPWNPPHDLHAHGHTGSAEKKVGQTGLGVLRDGTLMYFLLSFIPILVVFFQHNGSMPLYLVSDLHLSEATYGLLFTINTGLIILFEVPLNIAMAHWSHRRSLAVGSFLAGAGFGMMGLVGSVYGVAVTVVVWSFGEMILLPAASNYMAEIAPVDRRGAYMGMYQASFSFAFAVSGWAGTTILHMYGGPFLWALTFVGGCLSAFLFWRIQDHRHR
jgi:predicted MFS family arabinose efflux permease